MKQKQYPEQNGTYLVKVKSGQSTHDWKEFNTARLQISVGQEYHESEKLEATINWCKDRFEFVQICVNDTLQRFNLLFEDNISPKIAWFLAERHGNEWIERNKHLFSLLPAFEIKRWEEWKSTSEYSLILKQVRDLYEKNTEFKNAIDSNIESLWFRRKKRIGSCYNDKTYDIFATLSKEYLLEETSIFSLMFEQKNAIDIYPGTAIFGSSLFRGNLPKNAPSGLRKMHFCRIDFSRNKQFFAKAA